MPKSTKVIIDTTALSKKYKCDIPKIITAWKKGINDQELSRLIGINKLKLNQIRQEITLLHERERQRRQNFSGKTSLFIEP